MRLIIVIIVILVFVQCEGSDVRLKCINASNHSIAIECKMPLGFVNHTEFYLKHPINPGTIGGRIGPMNGSTSWNGVIDNDSLKKLHIYIFSIDTLLKYKRMYTLQQIVDKKLFDTILSYTQEQMDSIDWKVIYEGKPKNN